MVWLAAAVVFVALLVLFPRAVGYTLLAAVVLGACAGGVLWWFNMMDEAASQKVQANFRYDAANTNCRPDYPISLGFVNTSDRTVKSIYFGVTLRRKGYSGSIGSLSSLTHDKILTPGQSFGFCYAMPPTTIPVSPSELELEASFKYVTWQ
jgi:hypothetical protein